MHETTYHRVASVEEATRRLGDSDDGQLIAGGQTLIPTMKARLAAPSDLVDISRIVDLRGVKVEGRRVTIAAMTTHAEVAASSALRAVCPGLADLAGLIGDPAVRHRGTIAGSIANNDPAADYPAGILALAATIRTDRREIAADDFFDGMFTTALDEGEIILSVSFDAPDACAYAKFANPASRYALCGVFVARRTEGVRVAVTGAGNDGVFRATDLEEALTEDFSEGAVDAVTVDSGDMLTDIHGDAAYRANLVKVMTKRALAAM